jgi:hypothetical protein
MTQQEKTFIAFMEGVCKKFNCVEAVAPLSEGFKAYCETAAMARAFGKATYGKNDKNPTVKAARDSYKKDLKNYCKDKDAKARAEAFHMGNEEQWLENRLKDSKKSCSGKTCTEASDAAIRALKPNTTLIRKIGDKHYTKNSDGRWNLSPVTAKSVASLVVQHANPDRNETVSDDEYAVVGMLDSNSPCYDSAIADELNEKFRNREPGMTIQDCYDYTVENIGKSHPEAVEAGRQLVQRYNDELNASLQEVLGIKLF